MLGEQGIPAFEQAPSRHIPFVSPEHLLDNRNSLCSSVSSFLFDESGELSRAAPPTKNGEGCGRGWRISRQQQRELTMTEHQNADDQRDQPHGGEQTARIRYAGCQFFRTQRTIAVNTAVSLGTYARHAARQALTKTRTNMLVTGSSRQRLALRSFALCTRKSADRSQAIAPSAAWRWNGSK
jgi:hypothetical protein